MDDTVYESDYYKIDPDEPWRYKCPECGSVQVYDIKRKQVNYDLPYYCVACAEKLNYVIDRKSNKQRY